MWSKDNPPTGDDCRKHLPAVADFVEYSGSYLWVDPSCCQAAKLCELFGLIKIHRSYSESYDQAIRDFGLEDTPLERMCTIIDRITTQVTQDLPGPDHGSMDPDVRVETAKRIRELAS